MKVDILGVKIDSINQVDVLAKIEEWLGKPGRHYIVTPNPEIILAAQKDQEFNKILNNADLAIPDSSSLGFSYWLLKRSIVERLFLWPLFFIPFKQVIPFDRVSGTDLMEVLCRESAEKGLTTGFLGGRNGVAEKCSERLQKKYPGLKVVFADSGGEVDGSGKFSTNRSNNNIPPTDILFVAFGHIKQEKWIACSLDKIPVKIAIGVGGAFDYLSGRVPRAPKLIRSLGFEWLFRLIIEPWRIKRQFNLWKYIWLLITKG